MYTRSAMTEGWLNNFAVLSILWDIDLNIWMTRFHTIMNSAENHENFPPFF